jgi:hypothetical protein
MEETLEGGRGPPRAVAPLERERDREREILAFISGQKLKSISVGLLRTSQMFCVAVKRTLKLKAMVLTLQCHCGCTVRQYDLHMLPVSVHFMVMNAYKGAVNLKPSRPGQ